MSDTTPVNFTMGAARQIRESVRVTQRMAKNERGRGRKWPIPEDGGGGEECHTIRFKVISEEAATRSVIAIVAAVPPGFTIASVPELIDELNAVEVNDPLGCFFNETPGALVGREGWARYMLPLLPTVSQPDSSYEFVPQWEVFALCCNVIVCDS